MVIALKVEQVEGVELCGEEPWFAEADVRRRLRESVEDAHKEQKILVGAPADEVVRICPEDGRLLGAGAVLRLGGAHLGGYGESDIAYAYRQLSRALHPDKNPDLPKAPAAFHRLSEAAEELRRGLQEQRVALHAIVGAMGGQATPQMLERPQEALFAEACRLLSAVCGIVGEGEVSAPEHGRALVAFARSGMYHSCQTHLLLSEWFEKNQLLELYASFPLRTAYDCAPKRFRAQFLCLLNRAAIAEAKRFNDCVRGSWPSIMQTFPELGLWRELRESIQSRVWDTSNDPEPQPKKRSRSRRKSKSRSRRRRSDRSRSRSRGDGRRRRRGAGDDAGDGDGGRRQRERGGGAGWCERDRGQERQRDLAWDTRWTTSDDPSCDMFTQKGRERDRERDRRASIEAHVRQGWRACKWGRKWRWAISAMLPSGLDTAAPMTDSDIRRLATSLWKDIVLWTAGRDVERVVGLFRADHQTCKTFGWDMKETSVARGLDPDSPPAEWSFIPVTDLLLVIGDGLVGVTAEGIYADNPAGHRRLSLARCYKKRGGETHKDREKEGRHGEGKNGHVREEQLLPPPDAPTKVSKWDVQTLE